MLLALLPVLALSQSILPGRMVEDIRCERDSSQGYALYVPSTYKPDRTWPLLLAFDPRARGMNAIERFAPAAEKYGWIVAGSNNSRNGSGQSSAQALRAMTTDIFGKYASDPKRIYSAGMSGGARVAMSFALDSQAIAGVIACSAAFPDGRARKSVPFPIFGTAGTDDFNWSEMHELDQTLLSPHRVLVFEGSHVWMSTELAMAAIEFMELHAMRTGLRQRSAPLVASLFEARAAMANAMPSDSRKQWEAFRNVGLDFEGLHEQAASYSERAKKLAKEKPVQAEVKRERNEYDKEQTVMQEILRREAGLADSSKRDLCLSELRQQLRALAKQVDAPEDTSTRRISRRVTRSIASRLNSDPNLDVGYRTVLDELGLLRRPR